MTRRLHVAFFGSSLVSAYWNGAATYYRGVIKALADRGHRATFYEPDAYDRQKHRDIDEPPWCDVVVYAGDDDRAAQRALARAAREADVLVKASGIGVYDRLLEAAIPYAKRASALAVYWDVDAPATLARLRRDPADPLRRRIPDFDCVLTYGGGDAVVRGYTALGAKRCVPIYNAVDPETHHPGVRDPRFAADLSLLANRLPDREARVDEFFVRAAREAKDARFVLGGSGWADKALPPNARAVGHVYTADHNAFNASARLVLNVARDSMAEIGFSPATRIFEAAGAGACIVTDAWDGIERFLEPGREVLVAESGRDVAAFVRDVDPARARAIGAAARARVLAEHTYARRAAEVEAIFGPRARELAAIQP